MVNSRRLFILGASGLAKEVAQLLMYVGRDRDLAGFVCGAADEVGLDMGYGRVVGDDSWLLESDLSADLIIGVGHPHIRAAIARRYLAHRDRFAFPNLLHPQALVDLKHVEIGDGNVFAAGCIFTTGIAVGNFNYFNLHVTVGHGVRVGDDCVLNPAANISGDVVIGDEVLVGTGAQVLEGVAIGNGAMVGAGAVVTRSVQEALTVIGVPARPLGPMVP